MLKSFVMHHPRTDHAMQLTKHASVKGSGIDAADFVTITCFNAARGLANRMMQMTTPSLPMISLALPTPLTARSALDDIIASIALPCWEIVPGKLSAVGLQFPRKIQQ